MMAYTQKVTAVVFDGRYSLDSAPQRWRITMTGEQLTRLMVVIDGYTDAQSLTVKDFIARVRLAQRGGLLAIEKILGSEHLPEES
jgi:hypothetical protein